MTICERHGRLRCGECAYVEELKDKIESLQQQVKTLQKEQGWISVKDYTNEDIRVALTRELTNERVALAAAYWLDASPHERCVPDGIVLARYARYAMAEIERLREERRWISVKDRLPEIEGRCFVTDGYKVGEGVFLDGEMYACDSAPFLSENITHWQPLPEPPKEE